MNRASCGPIGFTGPSAALWIPPAALQPASSHGMMGRSEGPKSHTIEHDVVVIIHVDMCGSRHLNGVLEPLGYDLGERHDEVTVQRDGDSPKGVESVAGPAAFFES